MPLRPLLSLSHISHAFHGRKVLDDVSLEVFPGEIVTLVGPNGAGKTTLARVALGLLIPDSGTRQRSSSLVVGYMPQKLKLDESLPLTVDRFLWFTASTTRNERADALQSVGAAHLLTQAVQRLSGGEMQRVLLARALLRHPQLLVLDEPAQGVDVAGQNALYGLLEKFRARTGCAILMISHDLNWVMAATDRVICLQGHVCCEGSPATVRTHPAFTRLFGDVPGTGDHLALYHHHHDHLHHVDGEVMQAGEPHA